MKLYLYTYQYDKIKEEGYKSLSLFDKRTNLYKQRLHIYDNNAGSDKIKDILAYLEKTFHGRLRSICVITEPAPIKEYKHPYLNNLVHHADVLSFDLDQLIKDGIVEAIYCKDNRATILKDPYFENIYPVKPDEIDRMPYDWDLSGTKKYIKFSPWSTIKHYFLVLKDGYVPAKYIKKFSRLHY
ncbi:MAG: hypothetical protein SPL08_02790 [Pseudomonadota bacterium]|nr:hypothetical protein [Pseudomonadota bacterium]